MASGQHGPNSLKRRFMQKSFRGRGNQNSVPQKGNYQKEVSPFVGNNRRDKFRMLITALKREYVKPDRDKDLMHHQKYSYVADRFCEIIFTTPVSANNSDVSKCCESISDYYGALKTREEKDAFAQVLHTVFTKRLCERFTRKKSLRALLENREIPFEKKEKWIQNKYEVQRGLLKETDFGSVLFLSKLFDWNPKFLYQALEALLKLPCEDEILYDYINTLLRDIGRGFFINFWMKDSERLQCYQAIRKLADGNTTIPEITRTLLLKHSYYFENRKSQQTRQPRLAYTGTFR